MACFEVERFVLVEAIRHSQFVVDKKNLTSVFNHIYLSAKNNILTIESSDGDIHMQNKITTANIISEGFMVIPSVVLYDILRKLKSKICKIECKEGHVYIYHDHGEFKLHSLNEWNNFDIEKPQNHFEIQSKELLQNLYRTRIAMAHDDIRLQFNGVSLRCNNFLLHFAASDGHRLTYIQHKINFENFDVILPKKLVETLYGILGGMDTAVRFSILDKVIQIEIQSIVIKSRLLNAKFPIYTSLIPDNPTNVLRVQLVNLKESIERLLLLARKDDFLVLQLQQKITLQIQGQYGYGSEEIIGEYKGNDSTLYLNGFAILDFLQLFDSKDIILSYTENGPVKLQSSVCDDFVYIVMPLNKM